MGAVGHLTGCESVPRLLVFLRCFWLADGLVIISGYVFNKCMGAVGHLTRCESVPRLLRILRCIGLADGLVIISLLLLCVISLNVDDGFVIRRCYCGCGLCCRSFRLDVGSLPQASSSSDGVLELALMFPEELFKAL